MMRLLSPLAALICVLAATAASTAPLASLDFEQGPNLKSYPNLVLNDVTAEIVTGGSDGTGHCLKIVNAVPAKYCQATVKGPFAMQKNLVLSFDHKEQIEGGKALYLGAILSGEGSTHWYSSDAFSPQWRHVEIVVGDMMSPTQTTMTLKTIFPSLNLYGRSDNDAQGVMTVWLDNVKLEARETAPKLSDRQRISYSNPFFLNWSGVGGKCTLEYSLDPAFPEGKTTRAQLDRNFYMPSGPVAPGTWYWRVKRQTELADSWTDAERVVVLPESHRFTTPPIPADLATRAHPRLIVAKPVTDAKEQESLVASARSYAKQGVPDDPPIYAPGNPDWPTWIDWYGKVHGGITIYTGVRLQRMAELYARTKSPEVRDLLKPMAFKAASWNPEGGSSMQAGDIGAQHLLRGLNWCYDALYGDLTEAERGQLRGVIVARGQQFWKSLNPFRIGHAEYNNHAWLCTLALGETGLLLTGEYPAAADWAEYSRELYLGLYLCGLGWQGDNNEGISYWGYGLGFVIQYADLMRDVCGIDLFQHPWLYQTARFPMYTTLPGSWAVSFADTGKPNHSFFGPAEISQVHDLALRTKDPYALWYSGKFADADFDPKPPVDLPQSIHYRFIGWSVFNTSLLDGSEDVTFAMRSGPFWAGHQHEDQNSFVINAYGEKLAIDSGYYDWFGSPHFTQYSTKTRAHNAILVNGLDQDSRRPGADGKISEWFDSPGFGYSVGDASNPMMYEGSLKRWDRRALFIKPGFVVVHDVLGAAKGPAQYDWLLHTVAPIEVGGAELQPAPGGVQGTGLPIFSVTSGKATLSGTFVAPADMALQVKAGYPVEPVDGYSTRPVPPEQYSHEWTLWATPAQKRVDEDIVAVLQVMRGDGKQKAIVEPLTAKGAFGVKIVEGAETTLVLSRKRDASGMMSGGGLESDGEIAALILKGKTVSRWLLIGGKVLRYGGQTLVQATEAGDYALQVNPLGTVISSSLAKAGAAQFPSVAKGQWKLARGSGGSVKLGGNTLQAQLPTGETELVSSSALQAREPAPVTRDGLTWHGYTAVMADQVRHYWWATPNLAQADRYVLTAKAAQPLALWVDNKRQSLEAGSARVWLNEGRHLLLLSGPEQLGDLKLAPDKIEFTAASMLPADYKLAAHALVIEAEKPSSEGEIKAKVMPKIGASGGVAHCMWDTPGQWAEWTVQVPREGDYRLLIRGASDNTAIRRTVEVDRGLRGEVSQGISLQSTGGWCRTTDDWRYFLVNGRDGQSLRLHLTPGEHTVRIESLGGSMNLDLLAFEPVS